MIVYSNGIISIVKCFKVERIEHEQVFNPSCSHQRINALLVFGYDRLLKTILLVRELKTYKSSIPVAEINVSILF